MSEVVRKLANAKLTRSLRVVGRRADGFHLIESEMVTLDLADELFFSPATESTIEIVDAIEWTASAATPSDVLGVPRDGSNLVLRALALVNTRAAVRLVKHIPPGAGLGGGSSDAAAALRYSGVFDNTIALALGADVPFCLLGGRAAVAGVGEVLTPLAHLEQCFVVLSPALVVGTPLVYAAFDELGRGDAAAGRNDLEVAALAVEPRLAIFRALFEDEAGERPVLAGSGASFFIECERRAAAELAPRLSHHLERRGLRALVTVARAVPAERAVTS